MKIVDLHYVLDGKSLTERFDKEMKLINFINFLEIVHEINIQDYEIFYMNSKLGLKYYKYPIKEVIRIDPEPVFYIYKIENFLKSLSFSPNLKSIRSLVNEEEKRSKMLNVKDSQVNDKNIKPKIDKNSNNTNTKDKLNDNKSKKDDKNKDTSKEDSKNTTKNSNLKNDKSDKNDKNKNNITKITNDKDKDKGKENKITINTIQTATSLPNVNILGTNKFNINNEEILIIVSNIELEQLKNAFNKHYNNKEPFNFQEGKNKLLISYFKDLKEALNMFSKLNDLKKKNSELKRITLKLKINNKPKPVSWQNTNFFNSMTSRQAEYNLKMINLNSLPSTISTSKKPRNLRKDSRTNLSNVLYKSNNDSSFVSGNVSILKSKGKLI